MRRRGMHDNAGIFVKADTYMSSVIWNSALRAWREIFPAGRVNNFAPPVSRGRDSICRRYRRKAPVK